MGDRRGRRRGALTAVALLAAAAAATSARAQEPAQEKVQAPPAMQRMKLEARSFEKLDLGEKAKEDEVVLYVENLHLELPEEQLELRADAALLWGGRELIDLMKAPDAPASADPLRFGPEVPTTPNRNPLLRVSGDDRVSHALRGLRELYAEGHVFFRQGNERVVLADRIYQHLREQRGIIVEADVYGRAPYHQRSVDVHLRAQSLRILGAGELAAENAQFSTCAYGHPHWHVQSDAMSVRMPGGATPLARPAGGLRAAQIGLSDNAFELGDVPLAPMPGFTADLSEGDALPLKKLRAGHSTKFGAYAQSLWGNAMPDEARSLTEEFGLDEPLQLRWEATVDYYQKRGAGLGPALDWKVPGLVDGEMGGYWIHDHAEEDFSRPFVIDDPNRGRVWFRDRYTPVEYWRLDTELSWFSDSDFQSEYFEREFKEEKEPETYAHLVRQQDTTRLRFLYSEKINNYQTQTTELPQATFDQVGAPLWRLPLPGFLENDGHPNYLVLTHYEDYSNQFLDQANGSTTPSERVARADSLFELSTSLPLGPVSFRPFTAGQFTAWDNGVADDGSLGRSAGIVGARSELMAHRNFDAWMPSMGIDGLRHVVMFDADYDNVYAVTRDPTDIVQIDEVDALQKQEVYTLALRQRLQTHREQRLDDGTFADAIVNVLEVDLELPLYPHADRDNLGAGDPDTIGETTGPLHYDVKHRPGFTAPWLRNCAVFAEGDWNVHEGRIDQSDLGLQLQPTLEWTTIASWRSTRADSHILTGEIDWRIADKWSLAVLEQYDFGDSGALDQRYELRRHGHDFTFALGFERNHSDGDTSLTFAIYPSFLLRGLSKKSLASGRGEGPGLSQEQY